MTEEKPSLSVASVMVAIDALAVSLKIADGGELFRFTRDSRQKALERLLDLVNHLPQMKLETVPTSIEVSKSEV